MSFLLTLLLLTCALSAHAKEGPSAPVYEGDQGLNTSDLEALMMTTMNVTNKDSSWSNATPACYWKGVLCGSAGSVVTIDWSSMGLGGTPNLATLPQGLLQLLLYRNQFTGTPNLSTLPQGLLELWLSNNQFDGSGLFPPGAGWCGPDITPSPNMCGVGRDATFDCSGGTWTCPP